MDVLNTKLKNFIWHQVLEVYQTPNKIPTDELEPLKVPTFIIQDIPMVEVKS